MILAAGSIYSVVTGIASKRSKLKTALGASGLRTKRFRARLDSCPPAGQQAPSVP